MDLDARPQSSAANSDTGGVAPAPGKSTQASGDVAKNAHPGGNDALGKKENNLAPYFEDMNNVAKQLAPQFEALGLKFKPEVLLAVVLQESAPKDPLNNVSFDGGMGLTQITPLGGKLDAPVAKAIGWNNAESVQYNLAHSHWKTASANLLAGGQTLLLKATAIKGGVPSVWSQMSDAQKWRATMFAYNAGQGSAIHALKAGGPNAKMISTYTYKGKQVSHDYTAELQGKLDYVDTHDPFAGSTTGTAGSSGTGEGNPHPTEGTSGGAPVTGGVAPTPPKATGGSSGTSGSQKPTPPAAPATGGAKGPAQTPKGYKPAPTLAEVQAGHAVIEIHMAGDAVSFVQKHIGAAVDGEFGAGTESKVKAFQSSKKLTADGVVGTATLAALENKSPAPGTGGTQKGPAPAGGDAVSIAARFVGDASWSSSLVNGIRGTGWSYEPVGGQTNNCAEFVSSCLRMAGQISFQNDNVLGLEGALKSAGWKYRKSQAESKAGDVWIHENNPQHTVLIASDGGTETVGSDGGSQEFIKKEPMPYPGAKYMYR